MNILNALHQLLGQHQQARPQQTHAPTVDPNFHPSGQPETQAQARTWIAQQQNPQALHQLLQVHRNQPGPLRNFNDGISGYQLGIPGPQGMPQSGFGMQVQNLGAMPPNIQGGGYNRGPQNLGHVNPQLRDTGYFWNQ